MSVSTLVTTVATANANSYVDLTEFNQYIDDRANASSLSTQSDDNKTRALLQATREIDLCKYSGTKYYTGHSDDGDPIQALAFPRGYMFANNGTYIPREVKNAQCEQALQILKLSTQKQDSDDNDNLASFSRGGVSASFKEKTSKNQDQKRLAPKALHYLRDHLVGGSGIIQLIR